MSGVRGLALNLVKKHGYSLIAREVADIADDMSVKADERKASRRHDDWYYANAPGADKMQALPKPASEDDDVANLSIGDQSHTHYHYPPPQAPTPQPSTVAKAASGLGSIARALLIGGPIGAAIAAAPVLYNWSKPAPVEKPPVVQQGDKDTDTSTVTTIQVLPPKDSQ